MDITLANDCAFKNYTASYITDPINDIVETFASLIDNKPCKSNPSNPALNLAIVENDLEGKNIFWLLKKDND